jgi:phosphatidylglycerol---prolipoprotein diacylglyceryl transferase
MSLYGFFISLGILVAALAADKINQKFKLVSRLSSFDVLAWIIVPAVVGARLYHVFDFWGYYQHNLPDIFFIWQGGMGIYGGIIGGIIGLWLYSRIYFKKYKQSFSHFFLSVLDLAGLGLPLGQAIGRWGNFFNQELYGLATSLPWAIYISPEHRLPGYKTVSYYHPLFLYESLFSFLIFLTLLYVLKNYKKTLKPGILFLLYLLLYSFIRFNLEFLRIESWMFILPVIKVSVRVNQFISLAVFLIALYGLKTKGFKIKRL